LERQAGSVYRFGPFEADSASGELSKQGKRVRLQEQPFRLLIVLLENAGQVVPKAEIQKKIWEGNTFVDFDSSLRVAVGKLREALGDDAGSPHYIESIPKRGYRFLGSVVTSCNSIHPKSPVETGPAERVALVRKSHPHPWAWTAGILLALAIASIVYLSVLRRGRTLTERDTLVLADFDNKTGDPVFDGTLRQGLAVQLEQSPFLELVSDDRIQQVVQMMGKQAGIQLTPAIAREACERTGSAAVLDSSIAQIGSQYLLTLKAVSCLNGKSLASAEARAADKNHVLDALGSAASDIRKKLGESLSTVEKMDTPLKQATTPSLEALKAFTEGGKVMAGQGEAASIPFYKHAVELDPKFALAFAYLGIAHTTIGQPDLGASYTRKAYELRERTSEPEKYFIASIYFKEVTGNLKTAEQSCQIWAQAYPRSEQPHYYLGGAIYPQTGQYERAVEEAREAIRLNPDEPISYVFLMFGDIYLDRFDEAKAAYKQALGRKLVNPFFHQGLYQIAFVENDPAEMERQVAWSAGKPGIEDILLNLKAESRAYSGRLGEARELSRQAADSAEQAGEKEEAASYISRAALREALFGNREQAKRGAALAIRRSSGRDVEYGVALTLAYSGDNQRTSALIEDLAARFPEDTLVQFNYLPTLRSKLALNQGKALEAIEGLVITAPYEMGATSASSYGWNALYPVFVRGQAYLGARMGKEAAAEFQKIVLHRGVVMNEPIGALAHLGLARAYALQGDMGKTRAAYQDFLTLWKDSDPDIPILKQAMAEYDKLR
jgi:DNA-binding winged helix-turn-helix (wHTH) protein/tetratricopeptide (TPR) repeat protein